MKACTAGLRNSLLATSSSVPPSPGSAYLVPASSASQCASVAGPSLWPQGPRLQHQQRSLHAYPDGARASAPARHSRQPRPPGLTKRRVATAATSDVTDHPLVQHLRGQLRPADSPPDPEKIWEAYMAIFVSARAAEDNVPNRLPTYFHQIVLRAVRPDLAQHVTERRTRAQKRLNLWKAGRAFRNAFQDKQPESPTPAILNAMQFVSSRYRDHLQRLEKGKQRDLSTYADKARFILEKLRASAGETPSPPTLFDYHFLLRQCLDSRDLSLFRLVWDQMTANGVVGPKQVGPGVPRPTSYTYSLLLSAILVLMQSERTLLTRAQLACLEQGYGRDTKALRDEAMARFVERARSITSMATAVFSDMTHSKGITPTEHHVRPLCRIARLSTDYALLQRTVQAGFGLNLRSLDASSRDPADPHSLPITTETFNTILMALAEHGSAADLVAAFETLRYPLPHAEVKTIQTQGSNSLFETNFRGLFESDEANSDAPKSGDSNTTSYPDVRPLQSGLVANTTSYVVLLRHICYRPQKQLFWEDERRDHLFFTEHDLNLISLPLEELQERKEGKYLVFARYILADAVDHYESDLRAMASQLGYKLLNRYGEDIDEVMSNDAASSSGRKRAHRISKLAMDRGGLAASPRFNPPMVSPTNGLFYPFIHIASSRHQGMMLAEGLDQMARAEKLMRLEYQLLTQATKDVDARVESLQAAVDAYEREGNISASQPLDQSTFVHIRALTTLRSWIIDRLEVMVKHYRDIVRFRAERVQSRGAHLRVLRAKALERKSERKRAAEKEIEDHNDWIARTERVQEAERWSAGHGQQEADDEGQGHDEVPVLTETKRSRRRRRAAGLLDDDDR